jgi:hypothetical protein
MYKWRLPSFVAYFTRTYYLCTCTNTIKKGEKEERKVEKKRNERNNLQYGKHRAQKYQTPPHHLKSIEDVKHGMRSCLRVQVWVRMRWTACEACDLRERRKGRQVFFNVM